MKKKIAIIGSGISGLTAGFLLHRLHEITLFDPAERFDSLVDTAKQHDAAFINMHGAPGEDGLVQAMLDRAGCPYQGSGPAGSFLALHKAAAKQLFRLHGLNTANWVYLPVHPGPLWQAPFPYPLFVAALIRPATYPKLVLGRSSANSAMDAL